MVMSNMGTNAENPMPYQWLLLPLQHPHLCCCMFASSGSIEAEEATASGKIGRVFAMNKRNSLFAGWLQRKQKKHY